MRIWSAGRTGSVGILLATFLALGTTAAETPVKLTLDYKIEGPSAPFLLPLDKGYYKAEGLNVSIDPSTGALEPINRVASGAYDIGFGDINTLIKFRDANPQAPVKAIFIVYNRPPYSIVGRKSRGIADPKDLEGKKLGAPKSDDSFAQWPIFVKANAIDTAKMTIENVGFPVREPMLAAGQVDAITGYSFSSFINLKDKGLPVNDIVVLMMANYGVTLYGNAIFVNSKFAAENSGAVKGFLRAYLKGLKETIKSPGAAIDTVLKRSDIAKKETELERLNMAIRDNIATDEVKANGLGGIDPERFATAIKQLGLAYKFKGEMPKAADIFDDSFLPPANDRKLN
jgi:NitT/TauT family transport system substrate-binding protein